jgi:hypothetical protein
MPETFRLSRVIHMASKSKRFPRLGSATVPSAIQSWMHKNCEFVAKSAKGFRRDTFLFTIVAVSAILVGGRALVFATFFLVWVPTLRIFGVIDQSGTNHS